ncbi:MAG: AAA-type ATPase lid domain-containing protein, partial [Caulobacteraceae bacterium]
HRQSRRAAAPLARVDLAAPDLDPHRALADARGGALCLEEPGALGSAAQSRLLAALEREGDVRLIATSRRSPETLREAGGLREDLLCRLSTIEILVPPLRERQGDAVLLAEHFVRLFARRHDRPEKALSANLLAAIAADPWPGNVRALRRAMERMVLLADGERYEAADLPPPPLQPAPAALAASDLNLARAERALVAAALERRAFNVSHAARDLGLTRAALYRRMAKHGL